MKIDKDLAKKILFFGLPLFAGGMGSVAINYADTIILTLYRSLYEVGLYQAALPTSQLLWFFIGGISSVLLPAMSGLWSAGRKDDISNGVMILTKLLFMIMVPLAVVFVVFPETILRMLFGESFVAASQALQVLAIGSVFYTFYFMFSTILISIGKPVLYTKIWIATGLASVVLNLVMTPLIGIVGAAIAMALSYALGLVLVVFYSRGLYVMKFQAYEMVKAFMGGLMVMLLVFLLKSAIETGPLEKIILSGVTGAVVYMLFTMRFILNKDDLRILSTIGIKLPKFFGGILQKVLR